MYNARFENDNGLVFVFGVAGGSVFDMDVGGGISVDIGTSQGFGQVGEYVESKSVGGKPIPVSGVLFGNVKNAKNTLRKATPPGASGTLVFENKYYIRVIVKTAPMFSPVGNNGKFSMEFFAPYPYFKKLENSGGEIGTIEPAFSFPVNYSVPHKFGYKSEEKYVNIFNDGDVPVPFNIRIQATGTSTNTTITNLRSLKKIKINGAISGGESIEISRDNFGILEAKLMYNGEETDVLSWIDEDSNLFELDVGDNLLSVDDDESGASVSVRISFNEAVVAVYES